MNIKLDNVIEEYEKINSQDNYNKLLIKLLSNVEQTLILPSRIRQENDGFNLKAIYNDKGNLYLVAYTNKKYIANNDESFIEISLKGILERVLNTEKCVGLCINPDINIDKDNTYSQCIIPIC
jgi:hypothetical protein